MSGLRQIAIDGPAGAGKSTVAKRVAEKLGWLYVDTGAMYRAVALLALRQGVSFDDGAALTALAQTARIELLPAAQGCRVLLDGEDVSEAIRMPEVGSAASPVSAVSGVRRALVAQQQAMAAAKPVVMDGRDIGTVVLPDAPCKVFLTASPQVRARRRALELQAKGIKADVDEIAADIAARDQRDSSRAHSPLRQADDARLLDSSACSIDEVVAQIIAWAEEGK